MIYKTYKCGEVNAHTSLFKSGRSEMNVMMHGVVGQPYEEQVTSLNQAIEMIEKESGLKAVFKRYFLSDIKNQIYFISNTSCATSIIGQTPLYGSKAGLWAILEKNSTYRETTDGIWEDENGNIIVGDMMKECDTSYKETEIYLRKTSKYLKERGFRLLDNCVRTWFMINDIDNNYKGVVEGRNNVFREEGLTKETHYISSTGIGGEPMSGTVAYNAMCRTDLKAGQMKFIYGSSHLNPTIEYGVAFERGTIVDYKDRRKVYISGTASINNKGEIVHEKDITGQTLRMIENIRVLLAEADCTDDDIAQFIVYLRDETEYPEVSKIFDKEFGKVPKIIVKGSVCRPGWLIESECIAIKEAKNPEYAEY